MPWRSSVNAMVGLAVKRGIINMDRSTATRSSAWSRAMLIFASYYERSLTGLATLCVEKRGGDAEQELGAPRRKGTFPLSRPKRAGPGIPERGALRPGDRVRVKEDFVPGRISACRATSAARWAWS